MTARPFQGREERSGRRVVAAVARTSTASGCEGNETLASVESEPLMRRASEVTERLRFRINSDEHDAKHGVRSGPEQQAPPRACEQGGASSSARSTEEKQQGDVKRAGASARTSEHDRASSYPVNRWGRIAAPLRTLRAPSAHSHMLRGPARFIL